MSKRHKEREKDAEVYTRLLDGSLADLPPKESRVVRVFLSSTFTDMKAERDLMMKEAYPKIRNHCLAKGLEFQVVDMRWGVRDIASTEHLTTELCLRELQNCQTFSVGPNFVVLLGDRYGYRPYPAKIEANEFENLLTASKESDVNVEVLEEWYHKDFNCVPPMYVLLPITSKFPFYDCTDPNMLKNRQKDEEDWRSVDQALVSALRAAASKAYELKLITQEQKHIYFRSVTESEVAMGILESPDPSNHTICFLRSLEEVDYTDSSAAKFVDMDKESKRLLADLKETKIPGVIGEKSINRWALDWRPGGIDENSKEHKDYLSQFIEKFTQGLINLIDQGVQSTLTDGQSTMSKGQVTTGTPLYREVLHHAHFAQEKCNTFCGREDILETIKKTLLTTHGMGAVDAERPEIHFKDSADSSVENGPEIHTKDLSSTENHSQATDSDSEQNAILMQIKALGLQEGQIEGWGDWTDEAHTGNQRFKEMIKIPQVTRYNKPVILHGPSGCGKTAIMAMVSKMSSAWLENPMTITRFLGTSTESASIRDVLISICQQISLTYNLKTTDRDLDLDFALIQFSVLVQYFRGLLWKLVQIARPLVIILDSVDQLSSQDYAHAMKWLPITLPPNVYMVVSMLPEQNGCLKNISSILPASSQYIELKSLPKSTAKDILKLWLSQNNRKLQSEQQKVLLQAFSQCPQALYLKLVFEQAVKWTSFFSPSSVKLGATAQQAINLLFENLEKKHGEVLISRALGYLTAARHGLTDVEMEDLLSLDDEVLQDTYLYHLPPDENGVRLPPLIWKRVQFDIKEYIVEREADGKDVLTWYHRQFRQVAEVRYITSTADVEDSLHASMTDYFDGKWANCPKPLELYKIKKGSFPNANRQVAAQPLSYSANVYNIRKISELPYHLVKSGQYRKVTDLLYGFEWLYTMCKVASVTSLLQDINLALSAMLDNACHSEPAYQDLELMKAFLLLAGDFIRRDVNALPVQLIGMFCGTGTLISGTMKNLVEEAREWCQAAKIPLLVPETPCMPFPDGVLLSTVEVNLCSKGEKLEQMGSLLHLSKDDKSLYVVERMSREQVDQLRVFDIRNGNECTNIFQLKSHAKGVDLISERYVDTMNGAYTDLVSDSAIAPKQSSVHVSPMGNYIFHTMGKSEEPLNTFLKKNEEEPVPSSLTVYVAETGEIKHTFYPSVGEWTLKDTYVATTPDEAYTVVINLRYLIIHFLDLKNETLISTYGSADIKSKRFWFDAPFFLPVDVVRVTAQRKLVIGSAKELMIFDMTSGDLVTSILGFEYDIGKVVFSNDESLIAAAITTTVSVSDCDHKNIRIVDLTTAQEVSHCALNDPILSMAFLGQDDQFLFTNKGWPLTPKIDAWYIGPKSERLLSAILIYQIVGHSEPVLQMLLSHDRSLFITSCADNTVNLWDAEKLTKPITDRIQGTTDRSLLEYKEMSSSPTYQNREVVTTALSVLRDGATAAVGTKDGWLIIYDVVTNKMCHFTKENDGPIDHMLISRDDRHLVVAFGITVQIWSLTGMAESPAVKIHTVTLAKDRYSGNKINCLCEGGGLICAAQGGMSGTGHMIDLNTGELLTPLKGLYAFSHAAITSDGKRVISTMFEFPIVFDTASGKPVGNFMSQNDTQMSACTFLAISPDDWLVAACSNDGSVRVVDLCDGQFLHRMQHRSTVSNAIYTNDSRHLITSGFLNVLIWSMSSGLLMHMLKRHQDFLLGLSLTNNDRYLVTSSRDKTVVIWDMKTRTSVTTFSLHCPVKHMVVAPDLGAIYITPQNVSHLGILRPNPALSKVIKHGGFGKISNSLYQAQALALSFSSQKIRTKQSQACSIL